MSDYSIVDEFYKRVEEGKIGLNKGFPLSVDELSEAIGGISKETYYLILGKSKTGKSGFMYEQFIFNIALAIKNKQLSIDNIRIELYTLEIGIVKVLAKAAVWYIYKTKGIELNVKTILGIKGKAYDSVYALIEHEDVKIFLSLIEKIVKPHSTLSLAKISTYMAPRLKALSRIVGKDSEGMDIFKFINPNLHYIILVDHISLSETQDTTKKVIDDISSLLRKYRNAYGCTIGLVQQITPMKGVETVKITYGHEDARDSKNTFQDCDICISIGSPFHDKIKTIPFRGGIYHILPSVANGGIGLQDKIRMISVEKDRNGMSSMMYASTFVGAVGHFGNIPLPEQITYE